MGYTVFDTFDLLQFNYGVTGADISKQADIPYQWIATSKETNKLSKNLQKAIGKVYGDDWNSLEKLRLYQKRLNKVGLVEYLRFKDYYKDDLLIRDENAEIKKRKRAKEVITFKNIATRDSKVSWQMIKKVRV